MVKEILLSYKGKKINLELKEMKGPFKKAFGLMFSSRENAHALLFSFKKPVDLMIHSFFVFFDFIGIWLDEKNKIIDIQRIKPWKFGIRPKTKYTHLIEIPINGKYKNLVNVPDED